MTSKNYSPQATMGAKRYRPSADISTLIYELPERVTQQTMERRGCFRTEVRESGHFICGVHTSGLSWISSSSSCPDAIEAGSVVADELWILLNELEDEATANLYDDDGDFDFM